MSRPIAADHQPASNTEAIATLTAVPNGIIRGIMAHWSYSAAPTGGKLTIKSGTTTLSEIDITAAGPGFIPLDGFVSARGESLSATLAAGGSGISGKVSISAENG